MCGRMLQRQDRPQRTQQHRGCDRRPYPSQRRECRAAHRCQPQSSMAATALTALLQQLRRALRGAATASESVAVAAGRDARRQGCASASASAVSLVAPDCGSSSAIESAAECLRDLLFPLAPSCGCGCCDSSGCGSCCGLCLHPGFHRHYHRCPSCPRYPSRCSHQHPAGPSRSSRAPGFFPAHRWPGGAAQDS